MAEMLHPFFVFFDSDDVCILYLICLEVDSRYDVVQFGMQRYVFFIKWCAIV